VTDALQLGSKLRGQGRPYDALLSHDRQLNADLLQLPRLINQLVDEEALKGANEERTARLDRLRDALDT